MTSHIRTAAAVFPSCSAFDDAPVLWEHSGKFCPVDFRNEASVLRSPGIVTAGVAVSLTAGQATCSSRPVTHGRAGSDPSGHHESKDLEARSSDGIGVVDGPVVVDHRERASREWELWRASHLDRGQSVTVTSHMVRDASSVPFCEIVVPVFPGIP